MSGELRFAVLGPVRAWRGDQELSLGPPQQRAVLSVLLLRENAQVSMSELVRGLWTTDRMPGSAEQIIRTYISRLRKVLGVVGEDHSAVPAVISTVGRGYRLQVGPEALDLARFRDWLAGAQEASRCGDQAQAIELLDRALGLWGGSSLAGVPGSSPPHSGGIWTPFG